MKQIIHFLRQQNTNPIPIKSRLQISCGLVII